MWAKTTILSLLLASTTSVTSLGLLGRANRLCPAILDTITVTYTVSIAAPTVTITATPSTFLDTVATPLAACLSDEQATDIVSSWKMILTQTDRSVANETAQKLIADEFLGTSDSINSLSGLELGNSTFFGKDAFIAVTLSSPPISLLTTLDIFHDCSRIAFYWAATGIGSGADETKGVDLLYLTSDRSQINMAMTEFNSLAWAKDIGWKIQDGVGT